MIHRTALSALALVGFAVLFAGSTDAEVSPGGASEQGGGTTAQVGAAHCDAIDDLSVCVEYASTDEATADCVSFDGTVADGGCPADGLSGSCAHDGKVRKYFKTGGSPQAASYAEKHCKNAMGGTFTAAP